MLEIIKQEKVLVFFEWMQSMTTIKMNPALRSLIPSKVPTKEKELARIRFNERNSMAVKYRSPAKQSHSMDVSDVLEHSDIDIKVLNI